MMMARKNKVRPCLALGVITLQVKWTSDETDLLIGVKQSLIAVSYTHLTLPTKRIV